MDQSCNRPGCRDLRMSWYCIGKILHGFHLVSSAVCRLGTEMDCSKAGGLIHIRPGLPRGFHTLLFPRPRGCDLWWQDGCGLGSACPSFTWRSQGNLTMQFVLKISLVGHQLVDMDKGLSVGIVRRRKGNDLQIQYPVLDGYHRHCGWIFRRTAFVSTVCLALWARD